MEIKNIQQRFGITGFATAFSYSWDEHFVFQGESHEMWEVVFVESGQVEVTEDEKIYLLKENNMIIHAPGEFHRIRSAGGTSPHLFVMSFIAWGELPEAIKEGVFTLQSDAVLRYSSLFGSVLSLLNNEDTSAYGGQRIADGLSSFLIDLSEEDKVTQQYTSVTAREYRKIVMAMTETVCLNVTLSQLAHQCGDSISYMKQLFKKYAGISPKAFYNGLRVQYASRLLAQGHTVSEVARIMNFSSGNYFSAFFKKHTGRTPVSCRVS